MNMKPFLLSVFLFPFIMGAAHGAEPVASPEVLFRRELATGGPALDLSAQPWSLITRDDKNNPFGYSVRVGVSLMAQGFPAGHYFYRTAFPRPAVVPESGLYLLELGPIGGSDKVKVNGHLIGSHGGPTPKFVRAHIDQEIIRRYVVPAALLKEENALEVEVKTGVIGGTIWYSGGGIFQGPVRLLPLEEEVVVDFALRDPDRSSIEPLLSDAAYLNHFPTGGALPLRFKVGHLNSEAAAGPVKVSVTISPEKGAAGTAVSDERLITVPKGAWSEWVSMEMPKPAAGSYRCGVAVTQDGRQLYERSIPLVVESALPSLRVPGRLASVPQGLNWQPVHNRAVGSFGARGADKEGVLDPAVWKQDVRGTLAAVVRFEADSPLPMLLFSGVEKPPFEALKAADYQEFPMGRAYDGFDDAWPMGQISFGAEVGSSGFVSGDWTLRKYRFADAAQQELGTVELSKASPAVRIDAASHRVELFKGLQKWGLHGPRYMAFAGSEGVKVLEPGQSVPGEALKENWVLVWFHGGRGWTGFDIPWLVVLGKRPEQLGLLVDGISLGSKAGVGALYAMPLFGVQLQLPSSTASWKEGLPAAVLARVKEWSQRLPAWPEKVTRALAVDWTTGDSYLREKFTFRESRGDWVTKLHAVAPVPPVLALAGQSHHREISANAPVRDLSYVTVFGPYLGVEAAGGSGEIVYRIPKLANLVAEAPRFQDQAGDDPRAQKARATLAEATHALIGTSELDQHPWPWSIWREKFTPGYVQFEYSSMVASLPYLPEPLKGRLAGYLRDEVNLCFMPRTLQEGVRPINGWTPSPKSDLYVEITEPLTGQKMLVLRNHLERRAVDTPFWQSYQIYTIWQTAHYLNNWAAVKKNWDHIKGLAELPVHSHDWATLQSWDFFSGYRIGNGLQESGGIYAGFAAMARMAHHFGHHEERDLWAGRAVLQMLGLNAASTGIEYLRRHRPWSGKHTTAEAVAKAEKMARNRYIEYNEFTGTAVPAILLPWQLLFSNSIIHDPLPDVMRLYPALWPEENAAFFKNGSFDQPLDLMLHMEGASGERLEQAYERQAASGKLLERQMAARVYLESFKGREWERVIPATAEKLQKKE